MNQQSILKKKQKTFPSTGLPLLFISFRFFCHFD